MPILPEFRALQVIEIMPGTVRDFVRKRPDTRWASVTASIARPRMPITGRRAVSRGRTTRGVEGRLTPTATFRVAGSVSVCGSRRSRPLGSIDE